MKLKPTNKISSILFVILLLLITFRVQSQCTPPNLNIVNPSTCPPHSIDLNNAVGSGSDPANLSFYSTQTNANNATNAITASVSTSGSFWIRAEDPTDATCFQVYNVVVTIAPIVSSKDTHITCGSFPWTNGITYPYSNHLATNTILNGSVDGCDSVATLDLTVSHDIQTTDVIYSCGSYTWVDGNTYTSSNNTATVSLSNSAGCDSIVTLDLTIQPQDTIEVDTTICSGGILTYNGKTYSASGTYIDTLPGSRNTAPKQLNYGISQPVTPSSNPGYGWGYPTLYFSYTPDGASVPYGGGTYSMMKLLAPFWRGYGVQSDRIVNKIGVWSNGIPTNQWYGSTFTIDVPSSKTYYVMLVGDNSFRFSLDGVIKITSDPNQIVIADPVGSDPASTVVFHWLHIYPIYLSKGCHTITLEGNNDGGAGMFGGAVLDNTDAEIAAVTQNSDLNYLFSTENVSTFYADPPTSSCPAGMSPLGTAFCDECISVLCGKVIKINLQIGNPSTSTDIQSACDSYTWMDGNNYTSSNNTATFTIPNGASSGCDSIIHLDLTINPTPNINAGLDRSICQGNPIILTANKPNSATITWDNGVTNGVAFTPIGTETYTATANLNGCIATDDVTITVDPKVTLAFDPIAAFCAGTTAPTLPGSSTNGVTGVWSPATVSNSAGATYTFTPVTGECATTQTMDITVTPQVTPTFTQVPAFCQNSTAPTLPPTSNNGIGGTWNPAIVSNSVVGPTTYTFTPSSGVCTATQTMVITVNPTPEATIIGGTTVCQDDPNLVIAFEGSHGTGDYAFTYNINSGVDQTITINGESGTTITIPTDIPGVFDYELTHVEDPATGCNSDMSQTVTIEVEAQPIAIFHPNPDQLTSYNWESQMVNESVNSDDFYWDFGDGSNSSSVNSPTHEFPNDKTEDYTVMLVASSADGLCVDTTYQIVKFKEELLFYVPNSFTPDGDGHNEIFLPVFTAGYDPQDYTLLIFNRWGEILFESHNASIGWDGSYNGKIVPDGTYIWKIEVQKTLTATRAMFTGHVNVLK